MREDSYAGYTRLRLLRQRAFRSGSWSRVSVLDRALFRCALWVARVRGRITHVKLIVQVGRIALKLLEGFRTKVLRAGRRRAMIMLETYSAPGGAFSWAPQVRQWLSDPRYIWYLGILEVNA